MQPIMPLRMRSPVAAAATDPYWSSVVLLMGFEGADASTTFDDESSFNETTLSAFGTAQLDTAQKKFGVSSYLQSNSSTSAINLSNSSNYNFVAADFTIEAWVRFNSTGGSRPIFSRWDGNTAFQKAYVFGYEQSLGGLWFAITDNLANFSYISSTWTPSTGTWYHVAVSRNGSTIRLFADGVQIGSGTFAGTISGGAGRNNTVGYYRDGAEQVFDGWIDELRVTNGVGRYSAGFTPPTAAFPRS